MMARSTALSILPHLYEAILYLRQAVVLRGDTGRYCPTLG